MKWILIIAGVILGIVFVGNMLGHPPGYEPKDRKLTVYDQCLKEWDERAEKQYGSLNATPTQVLQDIMNICGKRFEEAE